MGLSRSFSMGGVILLFSLIAGCASKSLPHYYHPEFAKQDPLSLLEKAEEIEKKDFDNIQLETIAQNELSSHHLVIIKKEEPLHYHATHSGWAVVLKGKGEFVLGDRSFQIHPGFSVYIPQGVRHKAARRGREALAAFVIFTPPYDGKDTIPVEEK